MIKTLTFFVALLLCSGGINAQQLAKKKVAGSFKNKSLDLVLFDLKINYRLVFDYDKADTKGKTVNLYLDKMPLSEAMPLVLFDTELGFSLEEPNRVTIFKQSAATEVNQATLASTATPERTDFTLSGTIKDVISGESLPFTTVAVKGTTLATTSNVDGYFTLLKVPSDTVLLEVSYLGYQTTFFRMQPNQAANGLEIRMRPASHLLQQVNVTANREDQMMKASTGISQLSINPCPAHGHTEPRRTGCVSVVATVTGR